MKNNLKESLKLAIVLTSFVFLIEVIGGVISGSLSLLGDAGHMFRDILALFISLAAINLAKKLPTKVKTFGYHRIEIFAAAINGILLIIVSGWIFIEAYQRFLHPTTIKTTTMICVAIIGFIVNAYVAFKLHKSHDLNVRSAFMHVLTDAISSLAVIFAAIWIAITGQSIIDPILGAIMGVLILISAISIVDESFHILLEFTPRNINFDEVIQEIESVNGVDGVHNVHLWSLCSNINIIDAHIFTTESDLAKIEKIKQKIKGKLEKYNIKHATLEFEFKECIKAEKLKNMKH